MEASSGHRPPPAHSFRMIVTTIDECTLRPELDSQSDEDIEVQIEHSNGRAVTR